MQVNYMMLIFTWINFALIILIIIGIYKGIKAFKSFIKRNKQMDEKLDTILNELEKNKK